MILTTLQFTRAGGWSRAFPDADGPTTLVLVFGAPGFVDDPAPIRELQQRYPRAVIAGCSTAGEVFGSEVAAYSLAVAIAQFESSTFRLAHEAIAAAAESEGVGARLAASLAAPDLHGVLVLSDGLLVNGTELVRGLASRLGAEVPITGGLAGDGSRFERTWVLAGSSTPATGRIAAIGFYGAKVVIGHGSRGGWDPFGPERVITRSAGNVLYELDGKPALALYKEYLGDRAAGLPATALLFPLAIRSGGEDSRSLVRTVLAVDADKQSMTFAGDMPQGHHARLMKANFDRLVEGAGAAAQQARRADENPVAMLAIAVSCIGRRLVLGERTEDEVEATLEGLPPQTSLVGFYSYGEISPHVDGTCDLHNQTMTLTTICEADD
ncbi:MAG: FIST N-terminal domain-containing protein [Planctomycetota bacterium]